MTAPRLERRFTLEARGDASDGAGGRTEVWRALGEHWGALLPRGGGDQRGPAGTLSHGRYRVVIRAVPEGSAARPRAGQRLALGARRFAILAVTEDDMQGRYLAATVEEEFAA